MQQENVQETNSDALECKLSCVEQKYLNDRYSKHFKRKFARKPPIINRGTFLRTRGIDEKIAEFIEKHKDGNMVSLGAGSDARYFILKSNGENPGLYVEIDYCQITAPKAMAICKNAALKTLLDNPVVGMITYNLENGGQDLISSDYWLISGDLTGFKGILEGLINRGLDTTKPTLFLSECVLIYIKPEVGDDIISLASKSFQKSYFVTYEQINPHDSFGKTMISNLASRGLLLESLAKYPTLEAQKKRYLDSGYSAVKAMNLYEYWSSHVSEQEKMRVSKLEIFDEIEEWKLLTQHYCFVFAEN